MENTITISKEEYAELFKCKWKVEQLERIASGNVPSWKLDELIAFVLNIEEENNA